MFLNKRFQPTTITNVKPVQNDISEWMHIYDMYAPMMYGTILKMTSDVVLAGIILEEIFIDIHKKEIVLAHHTPLNHILLRHTFKSTLKYLEARGQKIHKSFNAHYPLINKFYFEQKVLKEVALELDVTEQKVLINLRAEFNHFCNK